jgi:ribose transport system permease protein
MSNAQVPSKIPPMGARQHLGLLTTSFGPLLGLLVVIGFFAMMDTAKGGGTFMSAANLRTIAVQTSTVAVAALGMTVIIIAGGIDLSAGTALSLCATVIAYCLRENYYVLAAIGLGIGTGVLAGFVNGALISLLRVMPFIVTLGTMSVFLGIGKRVAQETTVRPRPDQVPSWIPDLVATRPAPPGWLQALGVPKETLMPFANGVWLALLLAVLLALVLRYTVFGRYVFALGSNEATARLCGINVPVIKTCVYMLGGLFVGIAGLYQFARLSAGNPMSGRGLELNIIAAVVIGGASLNGGQGTVLGTLAGAGIMAVINSGCTQLGLSNAVQDIINGVIIVAAVTLDQIRQ